MKMIPSIPSSSNVPLTNVSDQAPQPAPNRAPPALDTDTVFDESPSQESRRQPDVQEPVQRFILDRINSYMTDGHPQTETCPMVIAIRAEHAASTFQQLLEKISSRYRPESTTDVEQLRSDAATFSPDQIEQIVDEIFRVDKCLGGCSHKAEWLGPIISAIPSRAQELADRVDHLKRHTKGELPEKVVFLRSLFPSLGAASPQTYAPFVQLACSEHYGKIITDFEITEALPSMSTAQCDQICRKALSLDSAPCEYACTEKIFYRLPYFSQTVRDAVWEKISATHQAILNSEHPDQVRFLPMAVAPTARCAGIFDQLPAEERVKWMNAPWTELI